MQFQAMGRDFETDDNQMLVDLAGNSLPFKLSQCFLQTDEDAGIERFTDVQADDFVIYYFMAQPQGADDSTTQRTFLLIRDGRVVAQALS